jgi:hypothetical protein
MPHRDAQDVAQLDEEFMLPLAVHTAAALLGVVILHQQYFPVDDA